MDLHQGKSTDDGLGFPVFTYADVVIQSCQFDTNLQDINDDCLLEIFSLKFLDPLDLCSLAEICPRFKQITQRVFPKKISVFFDFEDDYFELSGKGYDLIVEDSDKWKKMVFRVFKNFASCLSAVAIKIETIGSHGSLSKHVLILVATYCSDNLKSLELWNIYIPEELKVQLKPIFKQLQKIDIYQDHEIRNDDYKNLFADCDSLIELSVCSEDPVLENTYPKLERFTLHPGSYSFFSSFFSRHKSLKTVCIACQNDAIDEMDHNHILQTISRNCQELEELTIPLADDCDLTVLQNLGQLKKLEILSSDLMSYDAIPIKYIHQMKCLKSLETLELYEEVDDIFGLIPALAQLKKLRELYLHSYSSDPTFTNQFASLSQLKILRICDFRGDIKVILHIIRVAVNLEELQLDWMDYKLTKEDFSKIVKLVKRRSKVLTLKYKVRFS